MLKPDGLHLGVRKPVKEMLRQKGLAIQARFDTTLTELDLIGLYPKHHPQLHPLTFAFLSLYLSNHRVSFIWVSGDHVVPKTLAIRESFRKRLKLHDFANVLHAPKLDEVEQNVLFVRKLMDQRAQGGKRSLVTPETSDRLYFTSSQIAHSIWRLHMPPSTIYVATHDGTIEQAANVPTRYDSCGSYVLRVKEDTLPSLDLRTEVLRQVFPHTTLEERVRLALAVTTGKTHILCDSSGTQHLLQQRMTNRGMHVYLDGQMEE